MKGGQVKSTRLVQVFLSTSPNPGLGVYEVSSDARGDLQCNCSMFSSKKNCKHTRLVDVRIKNNNGNYPLEISNRATDDDAAKAKESNDAFREFVLKFGKIEVY